MKAHSGPSSAREDAEQKAAKAAEEALKKEEKRMLAKATAISEGRPIEEPAEESTSQAGKDKKEEEKKALRSPSGVSWCACRWQAVASFGGEGGEREQGNSRRACLQSPRSPASGAKVQRERSLQRMQKSQAVAS